MLSPLTPSDGRSRNVVIMGCGRVGASMAAALWERAYNLRVLDPDIASFDRLPSSAIEAGQIVPIVGDGTLEADLRKASTQDADIFIAVAGRDSPNALGAQIAKHVLLVPTVICRMNDPVRNEMYSQLGLISISATGLVTEMILEAIGD